MSVISEGWERLEPNIQKEKFKTVNLIFPHSPKEIKKHGTDKLNTEFLPGHSSFLKIKLIKSTFSRSAYFFKVP